MFDGIFASVRRALFSPGWEFSIGGPGRFPRPGHLGMWILRFAVGVPWLSICSGEEPVRIAVVHLRTEVARPNDGTTSGDRTLKVGDIAHIWSTDPQLDDRISALDIATGDQESPGITAAQLRVRLNLAGFDPDLVRIVGDEVLFRESGPTSPPSPMTELKDASLELSIREALATRWDIPTEDILVEIKSKAAATKEPDPETSRWDIVLPETVRPGTTQIKALRMNGLEVLRNESVRVEILVYGEVPVAVSPISRDQVIQLVDLRMERRPLTRLEDRQEADDFVGRTARQAIGGGQVVRGQHVKTDGTRPESVVQSRGIVRIVARKGALMVVISGGEALQSGGVGDWIRVRNPQSGRIITGRITGADEVEVPL